MKKRLRVLSAEEKSLWHNYIQNVNCAGPGKSVLTSGKILKVFKSKTKPKVLNRRNPENVNGSTLLDKKVHFKLKNGKLKPDRTIDLHGLTYSLAQEKVLSFIFDAYHDRKRLLLVITGKGKRVVKDNDFSIKSHNGVLKRALPIWLCSGEINNIVLDFQSAHSIHGGDGAFYVYLRKKNYKT